MIKATTINPVFSQVRYSADVILNLKEAAAISLQLFGIDDNVTLQHGAGASLTIIRMD